VVRSRAATPDDHRAARDAEERGRAGGMGLLAARCQSVWEVTPEGDESEAATLNLCAIAAAVALGPTLPPDASTLFGVRGAMERLERLTGASLLR
jgi:glycine/D-amino acid oxidase-like deaminating enzyme